MIGRIVQLAAFATVGLLLLQVGPAVGASPQRALEMVQFCVDNAPSPSGIDAYARQERWWRHDSDALSNLKNSSHLASDADVAWLADESGILLTLSTSGPRLSVLGEPVEREGAPRPVQACTVFATRVDAEAVLRDLENIEVFGAALGAPTSELNLEVRRARYWVLRSGTGEVAYVYAEFGRGSVIVEVGRVLGPSSQ